MHKYFEYGGKLQPVFAEQRGFFTYTQIGFNGNYLGREDKFSIRVYTEEDWAEKEQDDEDILLSSSAGRVYVLRILDDSMAESDEKTLQSGFEVLE